MAEVAGPTSPCHADDEQQGYTCSSAVPISPGLGRGRGSSAGRRRRLERQGRGAPPEVLHVHEGGLQRTEAGVVQPPCGGAEGPPGDGTKPLERRTVPVRRIAGGRYRRG